MTKPKILKPKVGDIYWFHGAYENYLKWRAVRVVKVVSGFKCNLKIVNPKELDTMYGGGSFTLDVRHLFSIVDYEKYKDHLEEVITPIKKEEPVLQVFCIEGVTTIKKGRQSIKLNKEDIKLFWELNNANR